MVKVSSLLTIYFVIDLFQFKLTSIIQDSFSII